MYIDTDMKVLLFISFLVLCTSSDAQSRRAGENKRQREYETWLRKLPYKSASEVDDSLWEIRGSDNFKQKAMTDIANNFIRYLEPMQFGPSREDLIECIILKEQYKITPVRMMLYCMPDANKGLAYDCYNAVIDSFLSQKYSTNFQAELKQKVDSMSKVVTDKTLRKKYGGYFGCRY